MVKYFFKIGFDFTKMSFDPEIVEFTERLNGDKLTWFYNQINCDLVDFVSINNDVDIIVDDEGLLKSGNPVFEVSFTKSRSFQLAGILLVGKKVYTNDGIIVEGFDSIHELLNFANSMSVKLVGNVR